MGNKSDMRLHQIVILLTVCRRKSAHGPKPPPRSFRLGLAAPSSFPDLQGFQSIELSFYPQEPSATHDRIYGPSTLDVTPTSPRAKSFAQGISQTCNMANKTDQ